ncbi:hypothetical protein [Arthrobacter sp. KBS0703]|nr:hypothetical protein [Arthrobacter sp. KBS0703]
MPVQVPAHAAAPTGGDLGEGRVSRAGWRVLHGNCLLYTSRCV